jgi:hypothetical protein
MVRSAGLRCSAWRRLSGCPRNYPIRPIRVIPNPPAAPAGTIVRIVAAKITILDMPIVVDNRGGARRQDRSGSRRPRTAGWLHAACGLRVPHSFAPVVTAKLITTRSKD